MEKLCGNCAVLENYFRKMAAKREEFQGEEIGRCTKHKCILSRPVVALPTLPSVGGGEAKASPCADKILPLLHLLSAGERCRLIYELCKRFV